MGNALILRAPGTLSSPGAAPKLLHTLPVAGYIRRYAALAAGVSVGAPVPSMPNLVPSTVAPLTGSNAPTLAAGPAVSFDSVDDLLSDATFSGRAYPITLTMVAKMRALPVSGNYFYWVVAGTSAPSLYVSSSGLPSVLAGGAALPAVSSVGTAYHVLTVILPGTGASLYVDGAAAVTTATGANPAVTKLQTGRAAQTQLDMKEFIVWPSALSGANVAAVHAALQAVYGI